MRNFPIPEIKTIQPVFQTLKTGYSAFPKVDPICKNSIGFDSPDTWNFLEAIRSFSGRNDLLVIKQGANYRLLYEHAAFDIKSVLTSDKDLRFELQKTYNYEPSDDKPAVLEADAKRVVSKLNSLPVLKQTVERTCSFSGDINSQYKDSEIYGNFKRLLGDWSGSEYQTDAKKTSIFRLFIGAQAIPLFVEVYPYRNGSKVIYSSGSFKYTVDSTGKVAGVTPADVERAIAQIKKVIND
ncbi:MAG: hypothetical protein LBO72_05860 [Helicobacteraceae bacterium]|nr:hypothetical protein [Helicobacteraceae bacterium]